MKRLLLMTVAATALTGSAALPLDFDKIENWTGEGPNRAALVVVNDAGASDPNCYVWGFRWQDGETPTGQDMFRAVCGHSSELVLLTQQTGGYGSTVCGIGFGKADELLRHIHFDFDMAKDYEFVNFDYYASGGIYGQTQAPGDDSPTIAQAAIDAALTTGSHVIDHPFDQATYGYPAYDYDCWPLDDEGYDYGWWNSAWYTGYWSYWCAESGDDDFGYSGVGFTGRRLRDGSVDAWSFTIFEKPGVGGFGEGAAPSDDPAMYSYRPATAVSAVAQPQIARDASAEYFDLQGRRTVPDAPGIYIMRRGTLTSKIYIRFNNSIPII